MLFIIQEFAFKLVTGIIRQFLPAYIKEAAALAVTTQEKVESTFKCEQNAKGDAIKELVQTICNFWTTMSEPKIHAHSSSRSAFGPPAIQTLALMSAPPIPGLPGVIPLFQTRE